MIGSGGPTLRSRSMCGECRAALSQILIVVPAAEAVSAARRVASPPRPPGHCTSPALTVRPLPHSPPEARFVPPLHAYPCAGVAVLSPTESGGCSSSDITEPGSPRSPDSAGEDSASARMPPWASEPAPGPRRLAAQPAPTRRPTSHRRITEYFNHKMKPQNGLKREADDKKKCLPKNGVTHDLEKYISYLSQTLSPKVLLDVGKQTDVSKPVCQSVNGGADTTSGTEARTGGHVKGVLEFCIPKDNKDIVHTTMNGFVDIRHGNDASKRHTSATGHINGTVNGKKPCFEMKSPSLDPSANGIVTTSNRTSCGAKRKIPIPANNDLTGMRIAPTCPRQSPKKLPTPKADNARMNGVVSSTTKLDTRMNGVTFGSNNLSLNVPSKPSQVKKETAKKTTTSQKRTNRKSSACIANSKNLTWSKANNLKQVQLQKQNCPNSVQSSAAKSIPSEANPTPKINIPNGVRQVTMAVNNGLNNLNVPNFQNCHPINLQHPQPCNGTVTSTNLPSFVAVPHNVMLTSLRIPPNGLPAQNLNHQNGMNSFNRPNVNVSSSPTKLNGQFLFPFMQNINGTVVQIPNLMAKMPNFVIPQSTQLTTHRQDHMTNQQIVFNGTIVKLGNSMAAAYPGVNKSSPVTSQSMPIMNKNVTGVPTVGMTVQPKVNYTVNLSHPVLVPQPGFIVTSVPNINVKETWSSSSTHPATSTQATCSNPIVHHPPPMVANFTTQTLHSSSIPIAPVKPPDNPIQGTDPPSSTVKETEFINVKEQKCDIPWLSKTVNNNFVSLNANKITSRPFAQVSSLSEKLEELAQKEMAGIRLENKNIEKRPPDLRELLSLKEQKKVDEVAKREDTIFTQITVLKDVSSNVESAVIEANFCSATTESSESGIGTDKSLDSPSDSQASKECDDDSSLSLSVSVCSMDVQSSQKSPILKQPKTLRFPPKNSSSKPHNEKRKSSTDTTSSVTICLWTNCKRELESDTDLLEHIQRVHVESQAGRENYVCEWERCKVRGKPSCSRLWLERHALSHGGNKPFKCIVDGCDRRFSTQILLERHVNNHFNEASPNTSGSKKTTETSAKLIRRNGKKLRYRRQPWSARMFDFFDASTMEGLAWRLSRSTRWRLGGACPLREPAGAHTLTLHAMLAATRYNAAERRREALLTYYPPHVIEDEWVPEKEVRRVKRVEIATLPVHTKVLLYDQFCNSYRKTPSPPPAPPPPPPPPPQRLLPTRHCTSSRLLNNLLAKKKKETRNECSEANIPMLFIEEEKEKVEVSGAKKRKMGRRYGGNSFWPCGR
ncbi:Zinc finger protein jing-like [Papilio xuthus]|uniref:Zinc finger protein jing-like n=1 Tax=Papilio xuthus TaxID=66420 RepID=A0A194PD02_PAPXU|nr:Zinc finger protein jing-like [Papilio xuthus]